jgi:tRNA threonylcarbamoyladenosine biosynthesis protein TsaE
MEKSFTLADLQEAAETIWQHMKDKKIWLFHGEMGAGKTTFIHGLCQVLGVKDAIGSPTYAIINEYASSEVGTIFHMDLYRLRDEEEALGAGVEDVLYSGSLCLVEWPERAAGIIPDDALHVDISLVDEQTRTIKW